jgi:tRNA(Ser,Leu) C12 N-acetylase TAN1
MSIFRNSSEQARGARTRENKRANSEYDPSENEEKLENLPFADQSRVALIEIVKQLNQINKTLKQLCQILENTITVEIYRGEVLE